MNSEEISSKVKLDVQALTEYKDEIEPLLVEPSTATFESMSFDDMQLWVIGRKEEYCLTFDEKSVQYGIAFRNIMGNMVYLGDDGSVADAYHTLISREEDVVAVKRKTFKREPSKPKTEENAPFPKRSGTIKKRKW